MRRHLCAAALAVCLSAAASLAADRPADKAAAEKAKPATPTAKTAATQPLQVPADAVLMEAQTYRHVDAAGEAWIYKKTPFGVTKTAEKLFGQGGTPAPAAPATVIDERTVATERGDLVEFQRSTPFGPSKWTRKRAELTEAERQLVDKQKAAPKQ